MSFEIDIIGTGSSGNCIIIDNDLIIDVGVPKKRIIAHFDGEEAVEAMKPTEQNNRLVEILGEKSAIFITHRHGDHLQLPVLNVLDKQRPWLLKNMVHTNQSVVDFIKERSKQLSGFEIANVINEDSQFEIVGKTQTYKISTFRLVHDVPNQGFIIENELGETLLYATDTSTMQFVPTGRYDYLLVEGNYDENKIEFDIEQSLTNADLDEKTAKAMADRALRNLRHLSVQQFEDFVRRNMKPTSIIYQLHESEGFGIRSDLEGIN